MVDNPSGGVSIEILAWRHFKSTPQFINELCLLNKEKLTTQMGPESQSKDLGLAGVLDRVTLVVIIRILSLVSKGNDLAKKIRLLWSAIY